MIFADGHEMPEAIARVSIPGKVCENGSSRGWFLPMVFLNYIVGVQSIILSDFEVNVGGALVKRHVGKRSARESIEGIRVTCAPSADKIGGRDQLQEVLNRSRSDRCPVIHAGDRAGNCQALMLLEPFVSEEKEELVLQNRTAEVSAKTVSFEGRLRHGVALGIHRGVEEIAGIQVVVAEELKQLAMIIICAGASCQINDRAGIPPVLRGKGRVVNLVFRQGIDGRLKGELILNVIVEVDAIDQPIGRIFALTCRINSEGALSAERG